MSFLIYFQKKISAINYPLWRASAIGQSGFQVTSHHVSILSRVNVSTTMLPKFAMDFLFAFQPPYKGMLATVGGMTWARAAIFYGSDCGKDFLLRINKDNHHHRHTYFPPILASFLPSLVVSTGVQIANQPLIRSTITLQNPTSEFINIRQAMRHIFQQHGLKGLWHGTSAGILKTVPKYCTAIYVKDVMENLLPQIPIHSTIDGHSSTYQRDKLLRSALKSIVAGIAGAALTNPLDVIRNEMFKTNYSLVDTVKHLYSSYGGLSWMSRGIGQNLIAVTVPVACNIFFTDTLIHFASK
jgi:hypothetical protein